MANRQTILVVDDSHDVANIVSLILENEGYSVKTTADHDDAVSMCKSEPIDLVICDLIIPASSGLPQESLSVGIRTVIEIHKKYPKIPVMAMSGALSKSMLEDMSKFGAACTVEKPFSREDLVSAVSSVLGVGS